MDLKTDRRMHYHGADGVYAGVTAEGILKLYWGESKVYSDANAAIKACLSSLAPFLIEPDHEGADRERDLILLADKADVNNPEMTEALKRFFDKNSPQSKRVQYCGVALVGFDADFYPGDQVKAVADEITEAARAGLESWREAIGEPLRADNFRLSVSLSSAWISAAESSPRGLVHRLRPDAPGEEARVVTEALGAQAHRHGCRASDRDIS
jgi:hypothetical protein